jgi:hypothetical protein
MERVPTAWREDPNWHGPQGAGSGRLPAHAAAHPSRWVPAEEPGLPDSGGGGGGSFWGLGGDGATHASSGEWAGLQFASAAAAPLRQGLGGWMGGSSSGQQRRQSKAAAAAAAEAESMGLQLIDYIRVPRVRGG